METPYLRGFISKQEERPWILLKNGAMNFQNSRSFERSACFYVKATGNFERFYFFISGTNFLTNKKNFPKTGVTFFC